MEEIYITFILEHDIAFQLKKFFYYNKPHLVLSIMYNQVRATIPIQKIDFIVHFMNSVVRQFNTQIVSTVIQWYNNTKLKCNVVQKYNGMHMSGKLDSKF